MNLQIISDSQNHVGTTNHTNEFTMSLNNEIDAENNNAYIRVLNVSYPLTIKNVLDKDCWIEIKYEFTDFKGRFNNVSCKVLFETGKIYLPSGVYTLDTLLQTINSHTEQYDIILSKTREGKIGIHLTLDIEFWYQQFQSNDGTNDNILYKLFKEHVTGLKVLFNYSPKLRYMLGLDDVEFSDDFRSYWGKHMTDIMDGVSKMFIYCDEVEAVGDSNSKLLAIVPIELNGQGTGQLFSYTPPVIPKKLIKSKITQLHIKLCDPSNRLIPFDTGTVNIECVVENA